MPATAINLHIEHVIIDEAVHRAGPEAVRAALEAQLPSLLAASTGGACKGSALSHVTTDRLADRIGSPTTPRKP